MPFYGKKRPSSANWRFVALLFFALLKTTTAMTLRTKQPEDKILWVVRSDEMLEDDDIVYDKRRHSDFYVDFPSGFGTPKTAEVKSVILPNYSYNVYSRETDLLPIYQPDPNDNYTISREIYTIPSGQYALMESLYEEIKPNFDCAFYSPKYGDLNTTFEIQSDDKLVINQYPGKRVLNLDYSTHLSQAAPSIAGSTTQPTSVIETLFGETWTTSHVAYTGADGQAVLTTIGEASPNTGIWYVGYERDIMSNNITIDLTNNQLGIITQINGKVEILATATIPSGTYERVETNFIPSDSSNFDISGDDFFYPRLSEAIFLAFQRLDLGFDCYALCRGRLPGDSATTSLLDLIATNDDPKRGRWFISFEHAITPILEVSRVTVLPNKIFGADDNPINGYPNRIIGITNVHKIRLGPFPSSGQFDITSTFYVQTKFTSYGDRFPHRGYSSLQAIYDGDAFDYTHADNFSFSLSGADTLSGFVAQLTIQFDNAFAITPTVDIVNTNYIDISYKTNYGTDYGTFFLVSFVDPAIAYANLTTGDIQNALVSSENMRANGKLYLSSSDGNEYRSIGRISNLDAVIYSDVKNSFRLSDNSVANTIQLGEGYYTKDDLLTAINAEFARIQAGGTPFDDLPVLAFDDTLGKFYLYPISGSTHYTISYPSNGDLYKLLGYYGTEMEGGASSTYPFYAYSIPNVSPKVIYIQSNMVKGYRSSYISNEVELPSCLAAIEVNRGRGGIVAFKGSPEETSAIYPGVKITSVDPNAIYNGKINFKLINERGIPLEEDAGPMMIVIELAF